MPQITGQAERAEAYYTLLHHVLDALRRRMRELGRQPSDLADAAGMTPQRAHALMTGERAPTLREVEALAGAMGTRLRVSLEVVVDSDADGGDRFLPKLKE